MTLESLIKKSTAEFREKFPNLAKSCECCRGILPNHYRGNEIIFFLETKIREAYEVATIAAESHIDAAEKEGYLAALRDVREGIPDQMIWDDGTKGERAPKALVTVVDMTFYSMKKRLLSILKSLEEEQK